MKKRKFKAHAAITYRRLNLGYRKFRQKQLTHFHEARYMRKVFGVRRKQRLKIFYYKKRKENHNASIRI